VEFRSNVIYREYDPRTRAYRVRVVTRDSLGLPSVVLDDRGRVAEYGCRHDDLARDRRVEIEVKERAYAALRTMNAMDAHL
jgi:hypothetical protein